MYFVATQDLTSSDRIQDLNLEQNPPKKNHWDLIEADMKQTVWSCWNGEITFENLQTSWKTKPRSDLWHE